MPAHKASGAQHGTDHQTRLGTELRRRYFLAILVPHTHQLDLAALHADPGTAAVDRGHGADLTLHLRKAARDVLTRVEHLQLLAAVGSPRPGSGITAADQVVDQIDMIVPVDAGLGGTAPTQVARLRFVLRYQHGL